MGKKILQKPSKIVKESQDYNACRDYIENKYKCDIRDFGGFYKHPKKNDALLKKLCVKHGHPYELIRNGFSPSHPDSDKLMISVRNVFDEYEKLQPPYQDFWHWIVENNSINNGGYFQLSNYDFETCEEDFQKTILEYFLSEFGEGENRRVEFYVEW